MMKRHQEQESLNEADEQDEDASEEKKEFEKLLKYVRKSVPSKSALIKKQKVTYITGAKLIDTLMSSEWATDKERDGLHFDTRTEAIKYCKKLLDGKFLIGGKKIEMRAQENNEEDYTEIKDSKKKRRFRIEWSPNTRDIIDSPDEIYIWQYDIPQRYTFIIGLAVLVIVIGFTLQPLWPDSSKMGMWFLSVVMMVLLGLLIVLYIVRWLLWALVYTFSSGRVVFWLLPNLDDDKLGVIDSFKPFYSLKFKKKKKKVPKVESEGNDKDNNVVEKNEEDELVEEVEKETKSVSKKRKKDS